MDPAILLLPSRLGTNVIKLFSSQPISGPSKIERLSLAGLSRLVQCLRARTGAYSRASYGLTHKRGSMIERPAKDKRSSLFCPSVSYEENKSIITLTLDLFWLHCLVLVDDARRLDKVSAKNYDQGRCYKTFYRRNLLIFVIS